MVLSSRLITQGLGESKHVTLPDTKGIVTEEVAITADSDDNVYVIVRSRSDEVGSAGNKLYDYLLYVFDRNYDMSPKCVLDIFNKDKTIKMNVAVDKNKNIAIVKSVDSIVYVFGNTGKLRYKFKRDCKELCGSGISDANDIMISSRNRRVVNMYATEGKLKSIIDIPDDH